MCGGFSFQMCLDDQLVDVTEQGNCSANVVDLEPLHRDFGIGQSARVGYRKE